MSQNLLNLTQTSESHQFTFTPQQSKAIQQLKEFLISRNTIFLLCGYAGTGKSTIIIQFIKELLQQGKRIALSAPTNKAVNILKKMATQHQIIGVDFLTIHQLLGLGMVRKEQDKVLEQTNSSTLYLYDIIILDECSMVGIELWKWIEKGFKQTLFNRKKLILMGDPAQLNPIGEKHSPSFNVINRAILTEVVRQPGESPVLDFITNCRSFVKNQAKT